MANAVISWAKEHPAQAGMAAIGVIVVVMLVTGGGSSGDATGGNSNAVAAYYSAVAQQNQAGSAVQIAQIQANAGTNQALIAASYGLERSQVEADVASQQIVAQRDVASQAISANLNAQLNQIASNERLTADAHKIATAFAGSKKLSGAQRTAVLQSAFTGQVAPVQYKQSNPGNSASAIIGSIGDAGGKILGSIF